MLDEEYKEFEQLIEHDNSVQELLILEKLREAKEKGTLNTVAKLSNIRGGVGTLHSLINGTVGFTIYTRSVLHTFFELKTQ